ncbi:MAG: BMP family ABC transporter substrate-binding protein [Eubacterium sp.]|nr:BMP family ABC transporter substrate-binding protein [Eubacterium sp.]
MKKIISLILSAVLIFGCLTLAGCAKKNSDGYNIVMITDGGVINDGAYNESAWTGVKSFAEEKNMTYRYYQPSLDENGKLSVETIRNYIDLASKDKAKFVVLPGEAFAVAAYEIAPAYSDINFILVDALPHAENDKTVRFQSNVMCVNFDVLQAGFLAGYTSVCSGNTKLGYLGAVGSQKSGDYGAGFVQGASFAANTKNLPVRVDYANYDAANLNYDYSFTVKATYKKISDEKEKTYKVNVVNGIGSGVYKDGENVAIIADSAPQGKVFDHWEVKSNTEGVSDRKVNISSKNKPEMNLLVGKCDCTIEAVFADGDNSQNEETAEETAADENQFKFNVTVENGTGTGAYAAGEKVQVVANPPKDGYMFDKWENIDNQGLKTGISMDNEYCYITEFEMVDRVASVAEKMFDDGCQIVFAGGNPVSDSIFTATENFDYQVWGFGSGYDEHAKKNCFASVVNDYGTAVKLALESYQPGGILTANCSNSGIYVTGKSTEKTKKDKKGNDVENPEYDSEYAMIYQALADGKVNLVHMESGGDVRNTFKSSVLTVNYWINE